MLYPERFSIEDVDSEFLKKAQRAHDCAYDVEQFIEYLDARASEHGLQIAAAA